MVFAICHNSFRWGEKDVLSILLCVFVLGAYFKGQWNYFSYVCDNSNDHRHSKECSSKSVSVPISESWGIVYLLFFFLFRKPREGEKVEVFFFHGWLSFFCNCVWNRNLMMMMIFQALKMMIEACIILSKLYTDTHYLLQFFFFFKENYLN